MGSQNTLQYALKEWAVAIRALERGDTALVVRKGGIREKAFAVERARFLFFPSYEHQRPDLLKPEHAGLMDDVPKDRKDDGPVVFTSYAEVEGAFEVSEAEDLGALDPYHVWTPEYAESRFRWRPKKPLTILVLRTFVLPAPVELAYGEGYGGCKSWIEVGEPVSVEGARPALDDEDFERLVGPALGVLRRLERAPVGG